MYIKSHRNQNILNQIIIFLDFISAIYKEFAIIMYIENESRIGMGM